ncbi:hypothetical protein ACFL0L_00265 [Patescibacteria group bacterium]
MKAFEVVRFVQREEHDVDVPEGCIVVVQLTREYTAEPKYHIHEAGSPGFRAKVGMLYYILEDGEEIEVVRTEKDKGGGKCFRREIKDRVKNVVGKPEITEEISYGQWSEFDPLD